MADEKAQGIGEHPMITISFHSEDKPLWPELDEPAMNARVLDSTRLVVGVIPNAMANGTPALTFRSDVQDSEGKPGPIVLTHTSIAAFLTMARAIQGRLEFLGIDEYGQPLKKNPNSENLN